MKINKELLIRTVSHMSLTCKKYSPQALVVTGVVGTVTAGVLACRATLKVDDILEEHEAQMEKVHMAVERCPEKYSDQDAKKDTVTIYTKTAFNFAKLYGPAIIIGGLSIACIIGSHRILNKRNAALAAAYKIVDTQFKEYRTRVVDRYGSEIDRQLRYNIKQVETETVTTDKKGKEKVEKSTIEVADPNTYSDFARIFDDGCTGWTKDAEANLYFLKSQQSYANDKLKRQGYLFLNEVYRMLGIPETKAGQIVGWVYNEENPIGDNFVDFGIYDISKERNNAFVNGYERTILLDFNVDGNILDLI